MSEDPTCTDPDKYTTVFENQHVRVLEYTDHPGDRTSPHAHPDSVMYTLSGFRRRLYAVDGQTRDVEMSAGITGWLPAQTHAGHNIGDSDTHVIFMELKGRETPSAAQLGPTATP
jgi:quercetin dioxygenase-like cupin family protein